MKLTLRRKIITGFVICTLILFGISIFSFHNSKKFIASNALVDHTNQVLYELKQILVAVLDAESSTRGYVITRDASYLLPFSNASASVFERIDAVRKLSADNITQQKNLTDLDKLMRLRIDYLKTCVALTKKSPETARQYITAGDGKLIQEAVRKIIDRAERLEHTLLNKRKKITDREATNFNLVFGTVLFIFVIILCGVYILISKNLHSLEKSETESANKNWLLTGNTELNNKIQGEKKVSDIAQEVINQVTTYLEAQIGTIYLAENGHLNLVGSYAFDYNKDEPPIIKFGQGLVGQAALQQKTIIFKEVPPDYIKINSGLGNLTPKHIIVFPFQYSGQIKGIIEIGAFKEFSERDIQFLNLVSENIGIAFNSAQSRTKLKRLNKERQRQTEELQTQQEELKQMNEELEQQTQNLKHQQEELLVTNEELAEKTRLLEVKNKEVEDAKFDIEEKRKQLEVSSRYKSEFLANMSHELRTPLNSLLILSKDLSENKNKNLDKEQVESAEVIYKSGHDLLVLINEVLDLSKIEAGKMSINVETIFLKNLIDELVRDFKHHAEQKGLKLTSKIDADLPASIRTDAQRLNQVLKNLVSNAIKFTHRGGIDISVDRYTETALSIFVKDSGIGIAEDKQAAIFEAFQQADGGTSRKYGGTGLGLSISRDLAKLLGAEIKLSSKPNEGSVFSIIVPLEIIQEPGTGEPDTARRNQVMHKSRLNVNTRYLNYPTISDDRDTLTAADTIVLMIEDDLKFASILYKQAHDKKFKCLSAATGEDGLDLAEKYKPHAIILDLELPGINGDKVLAELKSNPSLRHIPVHIISATERSLDLIKEGAIEYLVKPVYKKDLEEAFNRIENFASRKIRNLLIIEDDQNARKAMRVLIGNGDVKCLEAATGNEAIEMYQQHHIDCIVLDIGLPDMTGFELIYKLENLKDKVIPPIIIYTGKELSKEESHELQKHAESIIIKGVKSEERLLDETALFLHRAIKNLSESKQTIINDFYNNEAIFQGKKILFVDDDMRNVFALSKILKDCGMDIIKAENGKNALDMLDTHPDIDLVLMDIMMPEMDGYEATRHIRESIRFKNLPVIALTAKAMKDDRQKCIDAGANDYISKPVDIERLLSLMRVWLSK
ncbi:MAG: response regulator [Ferruginibacter sp.]